jgi:hypothetical protein
MRTHSLLHYAYATVTSIALLGLGYLAQISAKFENFF